MELVLVDHWDHAVVAARAVDVLHVAVELADLIATDVDYFRALDLHEVVLLQ